MKTTEEQIARAVMDQMIADGYDCYPEVCFRSGGSRADIIGVRHGLVTIVECKVASSLALLDQAIGWIGHANFVLIAHEISSRRTGSNLREHVFTYFGIGAISVMGQLVSEYRRAQYHRIRTEIKKYILDRLHPDMKQYSPGTQSGFSSPWSRTMGAVQFFVNKNPGCSIRNIIDNVTHHYCGDSIARACISQWIQLDKTKFRTEREGRKLLIFSVGEK